jgi:NAD(P)-dependent dehydrogenase (short-subunit alcohol dehydrogenase family)
MQEFEGRVAVVTGAASGIGFALAGRLGREGMRVVLADLEAGALEGAAATLAERGIETLAVRTDVTQADQMSRLAEQTLERFGGVHVVCNNAGVFGGGGACWEVPLEDWEWVFGVNVWGVIHGLRTFVPILERQAEPAHVVNTASMAGLMSLAYSAAYTASKHAVLAISECLYHELRLRGSPVAVSALCPEGVATRIDRAERNRPDHLRPKQGADEPAEQPMVQQAIRSTVERGVKPDVIADRVLDAIREERFYVLSDDAWRRACETRLEDLRQVRNPTFAPPVDG